jgi:UDP-N-acetylglucosamine transferase subunit ALG13
MFAAAVPRMVDSAFAQTADPTYRGPIPSVAFMTRPEFEETYARATLVVGHAGTGTILAARRHGKPLIVVPRRHDLGEHRNDHQVETALQLRRLGEGAVCEDAEQLARALAAPPALSVQRDGPEKARLVANLRGVVEEVLGKPRDQSS